MWIPGIAEYSINYSMITLAEPTKESHKLQLLRFLIRYIEPVARGTID
jgi:hypothetical protein